MEQPLFSHNNWWNAFQISLCNGSQASRWVNKGFFDLSNWWCTLNNEAFQPKRVSLSWEDANVIDREQWALRKPSSNCSLEQCECAIVLLNVRRPLKEPDFNDHNGNNLWKQIDVIKLVLRIFGLCGKIHFEHSAQIVACSSCVWKPSENVYSLVSECTDCFYPSPLIHRQSHCTECFRLHFAAIHTLDFILVDAPPRDATSDTPSVDIIHTAVICTN